MYSHLAPDDTPRNLFLVSDGHVGSKTAVLELVTQEHQHNRIFTLGVG